MIKQTKQAGTDEVNNNFILVQKDFRCLDTLIQVEKEIN